MHLSYGNFLYWRRRRGRRWTWWYACKSHNMGEEWTKSWESASDGKKTMTRREESEPRIHSRSWWSLRYSLRKRKRRRTDGVGFEKLQERIEAMVTISIFPILLLLLLLVCSQDVFYFVLQLIIHQDDDGVMVVKVVLLNEGKTGDQGFWGTGMEGMETGFCCCSGFGQFSSSSHRQDQEEVLSPDEHQEIWQVGRLTGADKSPLWVTRKTLQNRTGKEQFVFPAISSTASWFNSVNWRLFKAFGESVNPESSRERKLFHHQVT